MLFILNNVLCLFEKNMYSSAGLVSSLYVCQVHLVYNVVQVSYFFIDLLSVCSTHYFK